jgi:TIR domain
VQSQVHPRGFHLSSWDLVRFCPLPAKRPYRRRLFVAVIAVPSSLLLVLLVIFALLLPGALPALLIIVALYGVAVMTSLRQPPVDPKALQVRHEYRNLRDTPTLSVSGGFEPTRLAGSQPAYGGISRPVWIRFKRAEGCVPDTVSFVLASYPETSSTRMLALSGGIAQSFPEAARTICIEGNVPEPLAVLNESESAQVAAALDTVLTVLPEDGRWVDCQILDWSGVGERSGFLAIYVARWWGLVEVGDAHVPVTAGELIHHVGSIDAMLTRIYQRTKLRLTASGAAWRVARDLDRDGGNSKSNGATGPTGTPFGRARSGRIREDGVSGGMDVNLLYLKSALSTAGRDALRGRLLFDEFRRRFGDVRLAHLVVPDEQITTTYGQVRHDCFAESKLGTEGINCLYLEGGLLAGRGHWKIDASVVHGFVENGGLLIVADVDANGAVLFKDDYSAAGDLLGGLVGYDRHDSSRNRFFYGGDERRGYQGVRSFRCLPDKMSISDWLRPVYQDVESIAVSLPVVLHSVSDVLASGNSDTSGTLINDVWYDKKAPFPFAAVRQHGAGYVVLIAAGVSHDLISREGDNGRWLTNTIKFLLTDAASNSARRRSLGDAQDVLFLSHRSVNKSFVLEVAGEFRVLGIQPWTDRERLSVGDSLIESINAALDTMTGFVLFWSADCIGAPWVLRELSAAVALLLERELPIYVITLDDTPVPALVADLLRVDGSNGDAAAVATEIGRAVTRRRATT